MCSWGNIWLFEPWVFGLFCVSFKHLFMCYCRQHLTVWNMGILSVLWAWQTFYSLKHGYFVSSLDLASLEHGYLVSSLGLANISSCATAGNIWQPETWIFGQFFVPGKYLFMNFRCLSCRCMYLIAQRTSVHDTTSYNRPSFSLVFLLHAKPTLDMYVLKRLTITLCLQWNTLPPVLIISY